MPSFVSPFGAFGTRFKIDKARQKEWLKNPTLGKRDMRPPGIARAPGIATCDLQAIPGDAMPVLREHETRAVPPVRRAQRRTRPGIEAGSASPTADAAWSPAAADGATGAPACPPLPSSLELLSLRDGADQLGAHVRVCSAANALSGMEGVPAYATVENEGGHVFAKLCRIGDGAVQRMPMCCLEVVDIGVRRVVIVPNNLDPSELTMEDVYIMELQDDALFWEMLGLARQATYRDVRDGKLASPRAPPCAKQQQSAGRRSDSLGTKLPVIPEVRCAEDHAVSHL
jgi:hypothetical protein